VDFFAIEASVAYNNHPDGPEARVAEFVCGFRHVSDILSGHLGSHG
jgi:hypothetical protein